MKKNRRNKKVLVAMSGGVDSSVAAAILKQKGYDVIGITLEIWPSRADNFGGCCSAVAVDDAKKVAAKIGIPHYVLNFKDIFKNTVINNFIEEYKEGRTPNPCVRCNQYVKFEHLLKKADELGAAFIATGHYAAATKGKNIFELRKSADRKKDQSYALYVMGQEALKRTKFPLGKMTKTKTREIAKKLGLSVADKKDSQEICFIEDNNYARFLLENMKEPVKPGPIFDTEGNRLGTHSGIIYYTVGQRKGIGIQFGKPFYVVRIDKENNAIIIGEEKDAFGKKLIANNIIWTSVEPPTKPFKAKAKIRYGAEDVDAVVSPLENGDVEVNFKKAVRAITPGQSVVFYKKDLVVGGGLICKQI